MIVLKYVARGAFIVGVPSRDLTAEDMIQIMELGWTRDKLVASGLYEKVEREKPLRVFKRPKKKVAKKVEKAKAEVAAEEDTSHGETKAKD